MRFKTAAVAAALAAAGLAATGTATGAGSPRHVACTIELQTLALPTDPAGEEFGTVRCNGVLGDGVQHDHFQVTLTSETTGTVHGRYTQYFKKGTIHGTFDLSYRATSPTTLAYTGSATAEGGTGAFKRVRGSAKLTCTSRDGITHTTCTEKATLTRR